MINLNVRAKEYINEIHASVGLLNTIHMHIKN